jgi:parvulin-like peptidyl-prolyl isomerase
VARFEQRARGDIVANKLGNIVRDNVTISEAELKESFMREHDRAMVTLIRVDPRLVTVTEPTDTEVASFLAEHQDEVKKRYDGDVFQYRTPKEVRVRHILKALKAPADTAAVAQARNALVELKAQLEGGGDFAALAKSASDDAATKDKGGDLGFLKRGDFPPAVYDQLLNMKANELTAEPVQTPQGLHLFQIAEVKAPARKDFEVVKRDVARDLLDEKAREKATDAEAQKLLADLKAGGDLAALTWTREEEESKTKAAEAMGAMLTSGKPVRNESPWILKTQKGVPGVGDNEELRTAIWGLTAEKPLADKVFAIGKFRYLVLLKERETPDVAKFDEMKDSLRERALATKRRDVYTAWVAFLRKNADVRLNTTLFPQNGETPAAEL